jgi:hypothetical protein
VEGETENRGARTRFEGTRTEESAGHGLPDALRFDLEGCGLQAGRGGVEDAAGEGGGEDCLESVGHLALELPFGFRASMDGCEFQTHIVSH